jgi:putative colanic acid biosynthesis UDP-glucose lipid carrier transferase
LITNDGTKRHRKIGSVERQDVSRAMVWASILMRRILDMLLASLVLLITLPVIVGAVVAIKLESPGPILERQKRIGRGSRQVQLLSFRTTRYHHKPARGRWGNEMTRVGEFLHYTRVECLPQLINVLQGELTIFGVDGGGPSIFD